MPNKYFIPLLLLVYTLLFWMLYPAYQFIFDLDGIGYMSVTKHLAAGDLTHGINGFWPPLHSWLALPFYAAGLNEMAAFKILNGCIGAGMLVVVNRLVVKAGIDDKLRRIALFVCIPVTLSFVYNEIAADVLLCLLLLIYTDIVTAPDFFENRYRNIAAGMLGCLCYLAKTYALPFFILHFAIMQWVLYKRSALPERKKLARTNLLLGIGACLILALPWIVILYNRYGFVTLGHVFIFGKSGQLNLAYYFHPEQYVSPQLILAPPQGLNCHWENPLLQLREQPQYYGSLFTLSMIFNQARVVLYNFIVLLKQLHAFSFLSGAIVLALGLFVWQKKDRFLTQLVLVILVFPIGYLLLHVEDRFIWPLAFLILIAGLALSKQLPFQRPLRTMYWCLFFGSFLITPIDQLKDWRGRGAPLFQLAAELKALGIKGRFLSDNSTDVQRLAYLTGNMAYFPVHLNYQYNELLQAARAQHINYYFYYYQNQQQLEAFRQTIFYKSALQEINTKIPNLLLLKMN